MAERRPLLRAAGGVLVSGGLLGVLAWRLDGAKILADLAGLHLGWLLAAAALGPFQVALAAERWRLASGALGAPLRRVEALTEYALSTLLNQILPGGVAGDVGRVVRQRRRGLGLATGAALVDRGLGLLALCLLTVCGLLAWPGRPAGTLVAVGLVIFGMIVLIAVLRHRLVPALGPQLLAHGALSATLLATLLLGFHLCGRALGADLGPALWSAVPLLLLAMSLPLSWGGWGPRELSAAALLPAFGWTPEAAVALSATYGLSVLLGALPGGLALFIDSRS